MAGDATQFALGTFDCITEARRHLLEHFPAGADAGGMNILMERDLGMAIIAKGIDIPIAQVQSPLVG